MTITVKEPDKEPSPSRWHVGSFKSARVAYPVDGLGPLRPPHWPASNRIRTYFVTEDTNPLRNLLIHADFSLSSDRKHVDMQHQNTASAIQEVGHAVAHVAAELCHLGYVLDLLEHDLEAGSKPESLQGRLLAAVQQRSGSRGSGRQGGAVGRFHGRSTGLLGVFSSRGPWLTEFRLPWQIWR